MGHGKREINFELELLPLISVLAACICLLLLLVTWVPMGVVKTEQALGENADSAPQENPPSIFAALHENGELDLTLKDAPQAPPHLVHLLIRGFNGKVSEPDLSRYLREAKAQVPKLKTVVVMPHHSSQFEDVIQVMDVFKKGEFTDVGISPF